MKWSAQFLEVKAKEQDNDPPIALIILNEPIEPARLKQLWTQADLVFCADGGANRVYDALEESERSSYLPHLIKGDLDSIRQDVRDYYGSQGCDIAHDDDQYETDLGKCIKSVVDIESIMSFRRIFTLIIVGGLTGRFDQTAHTIHVLHKLNGKRERTWVVSSQSLACLLGAGKHELQLDQKLLGPTCGLLPIGIAGATLTTKGLEWDLDRTFSAFGGAMLSTSNHFKNDIIHVETDAPIVFTAELRPLDK